VSKLVRSGVILVVLAILAKCMGLVREGLVAFHFGSSPEYNSFVIAMRIPQLLLNMFLGGAVLGAFIPAYISRSEQRGEEAALDYARAIFSAVMACSILLAVVIHVFSQELVNILGPGLSSIQQAHATSMTQLTGWALPVFTFATLLTGLLNAHEHFKEAGSRQLALNASMILAILAFSAVWGVEALVVGFWLGSIAQIVIQWPKARTLFKGAVFGGLRDLELLKEFSSTYVPIFATHLMLQSTYLLDARYGSLAGPTGVSSMAYADRFVDISRTIIASSLAVVIFPQMSRMAARKEDLTPIIHRSVGLITLTVVPIVLALLLYGESFIRLFYQRGQFTSSDTLDVMAALTGLAPAALFFGIIYVLDRVFLAQKRIWTYAGLMFLGVVVNLILKELLLRPMGITGVALGTSVGGATTVCLALLLIGNPREHSRHLLEALGITLIFTLSFALLQAIDASLPMPALIDGYQGIIFSGLATLVGLGVIHLWRPTVWNQLLEILAARQHGS